MRRWLSGVFAALSLTPLAASADTLLAFEVDAVFPGDEHAFDAVELGLNGRAGWVIDLPLVDLVTEVQLGYVRFGGLIERVNEQPNFAVEILRPTVGARLGIGELLRPTVFAHVGLGRFDVTPKDRHTLAVVAEEIAGVRWGVPRDETALTWDVGAALDLVVLPFVEVGAHLAYNRIDVEGGFDWWSSGLHAAVVF